VNYSILFLPIAQKALARLPKGDQKRADARIKELRENPRPSGCVKLSGHQNLWRIRVGDYRIVYEIRDQQLIILIISIAHRREVYRGL
jgi:mRNA interferase RelE/StbE